MSPAATMSTAAASAGEEEPEEVVVDRVYKPAATNSRTSPATPSPIAVRRLIAHAPHSGRSPVPDARSSTDGAASGDQRTSHVTRPPDCR